MKIIEKGEPPEDKSFIATCGSCGCKVQFNASEFQTRQAKPGDPNISITIKCPNCKSSLARGVSK